MTAEAQRSLPTPFLTKTYQIVDDPAIDDVISWNEDGSAFVVWNPTVFARDLLPKYFKHNNLSSFVRQLNTYGFRKVAPDRWEFANDSFRKGEKRLLRDIQRRKAAPMAQSPPRGDVTVAAVQSPTSSNEEQVISGSPPLAIPTASICVGNNSAGVGWSSNNSNSNGGSDLVDENERLRRENVELNKELSNMKSLCSNIFSLMSNYGQNSNPGGAVTPDMLRWLDSMPPDENAAEGSIGSPTRLFGFEIGSKRSREEMTSSGGGGGGGSVEMDDPMKVDMEVKSEPLDCQSGELSGEDHRHKAPWIIRR